MESNTVYWLYGIVIICGLYLLVKGWRLWRIQTHTQFFEHKVVLITGASRGIGRALACQLAKQGAWLVLAARSSDQLEEVAQECQTINPAIKVMTVTTDVTEHDQLESLVKRTIQQFGQIDILINNAGIVQGGAFLEQLSYVIPKHLDVNLLAPINLTRLILPSMLERRKGMIVNLSSIMGRHAIPYFGAYVISKHALNGFSEALHRELAGSGVHVLAVHVGFADTDMVSERNRRLLRPFGVRVVPTQRVARRILHGMILKDLEITIGGVEFLATWITRFSPQLASWMWQAFCPDELKDAASEQYTE